MSSLISSGSALSGIDMFGRIVSPTAGDIFVRDGDVLNIPSRPDDLVTPRTVILILETGSIGITIENMSS